MHFQYLIAVTIALIALFQSCHTPNNDSANTQGYERIKEAREDSVELANAYAMQERIDQEVYPTIETVAVSDDPEEDAADDPAIWYNSHSPQSSLIFGTNKKSGIYSFDLAGELVEFYPLGMINNIDVRNDINIDGTLLDVIGGSNRSDNSIILYKIDSAGNLRSLLQENFVIDTADIDEVYGFCLYKDQKQQLSMLVNGKNGKIHQYGLSQGRGKTLKLALLNQWQLNSQPEGMAADDYHGCLYVGEEENGIWKVSLSHPSHEPIILPESQKVHNSAINYDIEGLAIYDQADGKGFLIASIQGSFSFALFDRIENDYLGSFKIVEDNHIDGVEETDGLEVFSMPIPGFQQGFLVTQDGFNYKDTILVGQNFKYTSMIQVLRLVDEFRENSTSR